MVRMPDPKRVYKSGFDNNYNLLFFALLGIALVGCVFLTWKDVKAGLIYFFMLTAVVIIIVLLKLAIKNDDKMSKITKYVRVPFTTSTGLAVFFFLIGFGIPILLELILKIVQSSFSITSFSVPYFANDIVDSLQSFSTAEISNNNAWTLFTVMFSAGTIETITYSFSAVLLGVLFGLLVSELLNDGKDGNILKKITLISIIAFAFSVIVFIISHQLNGTYEGWMFAIAGLFILFSNISVYYFGVFLVFWMGYHMSNNLLYLIKVLGWGAVIDGFLSWFGFLLFGLIALMIFYLLRNWTSIRKELAHFGNS